MPGTEVPAPANPLVAALLAGTAPRPLKISAARGVLPVMRAELLKILVVLVRDGDLEVRAEAVTRLGSFSEDEVRPLLEDPATPEEILDHFGTDPACSPALRESLLANTATPAETISKILPALTSPQIDLMLLNLTRLIAHPDLLGQLETSGVSLTPLQRSRIEEIRHHFLRAPAAADQTPATARDVHPPAAPKPGAETLAETTVTPSTAAAPAAVDPETSVLIANATQKILKMNTAEKVQLAFKGTREERWILIKDTSKLVQEAVLDSPKLNENEVEGISKMRSVGEDVLRNIAANREWMKNYAVCHAIAVNPKTPVGVAINLVSRLTVHDLKILGSDKNVSEVIRRQARKIIQSRNQRGQH